MKVTFKLLLPLAATPKEARAMVTIPAGTVVEVRPMLHKGRITEVLWEGECLCRPLDDLLGACPVDDARKVGGVVTRAAERCETPSLGRS